MDDLRLSQIEMFSNLSAQSTYTLYKTLLFEIYEFRMKHSEIKGKLL